MSTATNYVPAPDVVDVGITVVGADFFNARYLTVTINPAASIDASDIWDIVIKVVPIE